MGNDFGMESDEARWEEALTNLHLLSLSRFSGSFTFHLHNGRVSRSTLKQINDLARGYRELTQHRMEDATCRT